MRYDIYRQLMKSFDDDDVIDWITINGNHIPVYEGMTKYAAASRWIEQKKGDIIGREYRDKTKNFSSVQHAQAEKNITNNILICTMNKRFWRKN